MHVSCEGLGDQSNGVSCKGGSEGALGSAVEEAVEGAVEKAVGGGCWGIAVGVAVESIGTTTVAFGLVPQIESKRQLSWVCGTHY